MGEVIRFVSREELERIRHDRQSRRRNSSMVPPTASIGEPSDHKSELVDG